jgi:hypothetical protein
VGTEFEVPRGLVDRPNHFLGAAPLRKLEMDAEGETERGKESVELELEGTVSIASGWRFLRDFGGIKVVVCSHATRRQTLGSVSQKMRKKNQICSG